MLHDGTTELMGPDRSETARQFVRVPGECVLAWKDLPVGSTERVLIVFSETGDLRSGPTPVRVSFWSFTSRYARTPSEFL